MHKGKKLALLLLAAGIAALSIGIGGSGTAGGGHYKSQKEASGHGPAGHVF